MHTYRRVDTEHTQRSFEHRHNDDSAADAKQPGQYAGDATGHQHGGSEDDPGFQASEPFRRRAIRHDA